MREGLDIPMRFDCKGPPILTGAAEGDKMFYLHGRLEPLLCEEMHLLTWDYGYMLWKGAANMDCPVDEPSIPSTLKINAGRSRTSSLDAARLSLASALVRGR